MILAMPAFRGFPIEAIDFLRELEDNNDRDWFKANRARYDEHLVATPPRRSCAGCTGRELAALRRRSGQAQRGRHRARHDRRG